MGIIKDIHGDIEREAALLLDRYRDTLMLEALTLSSGDSHAAEELVLQTFEAYLFGRERFDPAKGELLPWLRGILRNIHGKAGRGKSVKAVSYLSQDELELISEIRRQDNSTDEEILSNSDSEVIRKVIEALPDKTRRIIVLRCFESASFGEIARLLGISEISVKNRFYYARKLLARRLGKLLGRAPAIALGVILAGASLLYAAAVVTGLAPMPFAATEPVAGEPEVVFNAKSTKDTEGALTGLPAEGTDPEPAVSSLSSQAPASNHESRTTNRETNGDSPQGFEAITANSNTNTEENAMNTQMVKSVAVKAMAAGAMLMVAPEVQADFYYLRGNDNTDANNASALDGKNRDGVQRSYGGWTNSTGTVDWGMTGSHSYVVRNTGSYNLIYTPFVTVDWQAPANASFYIEPGDELRLAAKGPYQEGIVDFYVTFGDVAVGDGALLSLVPSYGFDDSTCTHYIGGNFTLGANSELRLQHQTVASKNRVSQFALVATVAGRGAITCVPMDSTAGATRNTVITGDLSRFTGDIVQYGSGFVQNGASRLWLNGEKSLPGDPPAGETSSMVVTNSGALVITRDWVSGANRSWVFGDSGTPVVGIGMGAKVEIRGRVTGSCGFSKRNFGTVVFAGEAELSGTISVLEGVVDVREPAVSMCTSVTWSVSDGAAVHFPDSIEMPVRYLMGTDVGGSSSMSGAGSCAGWAETDGGAQVAKGASRSTRYILDHDYILRPPASRNAHYAFPGNTLTVKTGRIAHVLSSSGNYNLTFAELAVAEDGFCRMICASGYHHYGWDGMYRLGEGGVMFFYPMGAQANDIYATISGTGTLRFGYHDSTASPTTGDNTLYGDLSAFTGVIETYGLGSSERPTLGFATAQSFPGDCAAATADGFVVTNGARLAFAASGEIGPNRGILFGSGVRPVVDVAADETVTINSAATGTSGFEKTGSGTLVFTGNLRSLTGVVKVTTGTLVLPHKSRCGAFTLDVASGASVVYSSAGVGSVYYIR